VFEDQALDYGEVAAEVILGLTSVRVGPKTLLQ